MATIGVFSAVVIVAVIVGFLAFLYYFLLGMWIRTIAAGVPLSIITLIRMRLMGIQPSVIVTNLVRARKAGRAIVDEAERRGTEIIVLGAPRGRHRDIFGKTVDYVLKNAPCRVWVARAPRPPDAA